MNIWGILIFLIGIVAYFFTKQKYPFLAFLAGVGAGIAIGWFWFLYMLFTPAP